MDGNTALLVLLIDLQRDKSHAQQQAQQLAAQLAEARVRVAELEKEVATAWEEAEVAYRGIVFEIDTPTGHDIPSMLADLVKRANKERKTISTNFNGTVAVVTPRDTPESALERWLEARQVIDTQV